MPHARLLLLFVVARTGASLTPGLATFRRHTGTSPRTSRLCCTSVNDDDETPPNSYELSAYDISREVAKYNSPGLRIRQSGPVRKTFGAVADIFGQAGALAVFLRGAVSIVPFYGMMMGMLCIAFALQQSAPRAAMLAGARVNSAIQNGQWHRLVSPVFLHGGGMHLASNLFSLYRVGPLVEASLGPARAALLYLLSGIGGNLAGLWFGASRGMSIGASGAVFGMIGATGGYVLRNKRALGGYGDILLRNAVQILALNLFIGTRSRGIDNLAHVGGFVTGGICAILLSPDVARGRPRRGRWDDDYQDPVTEGDGTIVPPWGVRALLAASVVAYALGIQEATRIARAVQRVYGRA